MQGLLGGMVGGEWRMGNGGWRIFGSRRQEPCFYELGGGNLAKNPNRSDGPEFSTLVDSSIYH